MTSLKTSAGSNDSVLYCRAHSRCFALFTSQICWQYLLPLKVQPSEVRQWRIVRREMVYPCSFSMACSWTAVVSSSSCIFCSTNALISAVILEGWPEPGLLAMLPVSWYFFRNLAIPTRVAQSPSSSSKWQIVGGLKPWRLWSSIHCNLYSLKTILPTYSLDSFLVHCAYKLEADLNPWQGISVAVWPHSVTGYGPPPYFNHGLTINHCRPFARSYF